MKEYLLKNRRRVIRNLLFISILLIASLIGYFMAKFEGTVNPEESEAEPLPAAADEQRTDSDCKVAWEFKYETCGHTLYAESEIPDEMKGLTLKEA